MLPATPCAAPRYLFPIINTMVALKFQFQNIVVVRCSLGLRRWCSGKEYACQCRRWEFNPWVRKIPWRRIWQPIPVFLPGKSHDRGGWRATVLGVIKSWTRLIDWTTILIFIKAVVLKVWIFRVVSAVSGNLSEMQILGLTPDSQNQ